MSNECLSHPDGIPELQRRPGLVLGDPLWLAVLASGALVPT